MSTESYIQSSGGKQHHQRQNSRFSLLFPRSASRLLMSSKRVSKTRSQLSLKIESKIEINLDGVNRDGIYRPGDTIRGQVSLDGSNMEGKALQGVTVRIEGKASSPRFEVQINTLMNKIEKIVRTREWTFYSAQTVLYPPKISSSIGGIIKQRKQQLNMHGSHLLPFTFKLPHQDLSEEFNHQIMEHSALNRSKPTSLPPSCSIGCTTPTGKKSITTRSLKTILQAPLQAPKAKAGCDIQYYLIVEVQWQRSLLHSNKLSAKMDFVLHPSPPSTATVVYTNDSDSQQRQSLLSQSRLRCRTNRLLQSGRGTTQQSRQRQVFSSLLQELSLERPPLLCERRALSNGQRQREVALVDSTSGPRGWYIDRCTYHLFNGFDVLFEFSYPAMPCIIMDDLIPFKLTVTFPAQLDDNIRLAAANVNLRLLRTVDSYSLGGRIGLEKKKVLFNIIGSSVLQVTDLERKDTSPAPTDEYSNNTSSSKHSSQSFTGSFRIESGLNPAQEALLKSKSATFDAVNQANVQEQQSFDEHVTVPSFLFCGLSVIYTIRIEVSLLQLRREPSAKSSVVEMLESIDAFVETSSINLQSRPASSREMESRQSQRRRSGQVVEDRPPSRLAHLTPSHFSALESESDLRHRRQSLLRTTLVEEQDTNEMMHCQNTVCTVNQLEESHSPFVNPKGDHIDCCHSTRPSMESHLRENEVAPQTLNFEPTIQSAPFNPERYKHDSLADQSNDSRDLVEYLDDSITIQGSAALVRNHTTFSQHSARTLDGLPPPYSSSILSE